MDTSEPTSIKYEWKKAVLFSVPDPVDPLFLIMNPWIQIRIRKYSQILTYFFNGQKNVQVRPGSVITCNWPSGSGSIIQDYGSVDPDLLWIRNTGIIEPSEPSLLQPNSTRSATAWRRGTAPLCWSGTASLGRTPFTGRTPTSLRTGCLLELIIAVQNLLCCHK